VTAGILFRFGEFKRTEDFIGDGNGISEVLQSGSILPEFVVPKVVVSSACCEDQVIVVLHSHGRRR